jgi:tRNA(adenine34) deaminase
VESKISRRLLLGGGLSILAGELVRPASGGELVQSGSGGGLVQAASGGELPGLPDLDHEHFMQLAIDAGKKIPACPFGSVVVNMQTKQVVAEGWVRVEKNPIWHGEMTAIYNCPDVDKGFDWKQVCLYTTGESCPMCQSAIIWTGMPLVVYGSSMPFLQSQGFGEIDIRAKTVIEASRKGKCKIIGGVLEKQCNQLFLDARKLGDKVE